MKQIFVRIAWAVAGLVLAAGFAPVAMAQAWPAKPIKVVIGFPPGTIIDATMRLVGAEMEKKLGQQIVLEFKPGANGTIGAKAVVTAPPDGYTLSYGNSVSIHPLFTRNNAVDVTKEMVSVSNVMTTPFYFIASGKLPARNFDELLKFARTKPDGLAQGNSVEVIDLIFGMLKDRTGFISRSIPYKGSSQVVVAMLAGEVDVTIGSILAYIPHVTAGTVRPMFILSASRHPQFPNLPTAAEVGIPNFELALDYGLWAPPGTPNEIVQRLAVEAATGARVPSVAEQIRKLGSEPVGSTSEEQLRTFNGQMKVWADAIQRSGFKPK
jgi:tripartite-type tricarboxylate transporter receptor subunit TctC